MALVAWVMAGVVADLCHCQPLAALTSQQLAAVASAREFRWQPEWVFVEMSRYRQYIQWKTLLARMQRCIRTATCPALACHTAFACQSQKADAAAAGGSVKGLCWSRFSERFAAYSMCLSNYIMLLLMKMACA